MGPVYRAAQRSVKAAAGPVIPRWADFGMMAMVPGLKTFWIDRHETTIGEYKAFLDDIAAGKRVPEHPFIGKRLPTEAECTRAMRNSPLLERADKWAPVYADARD